MGYKTIGVRDILLGPMGLKSGLPVDFLLNAPFDALDQGYSNGQVLDTIAEGVVIGQLTVVEVDGTLALSSNKLAFTAQSTPVFGDLGLYSQAITRALGRVFVSTVNYSTLPAGATYSHPSIVLSATPSTRIYAYFTDNSGQLHLLKDGSASVANVGTLSASTDYQFCLVCGGYDINRVPYRTGQTASNYLYGASAFIKGGAYSNWTLLWRSSDNNTSTIYAGFQNRSGVGTLDDFKVTSTTYPAILQPVNLSTFTAANGTSLDAITPEVGGVWTEDVGNWDIQGNKASISATGIATVDSGISDYLGRCAVTPQYVDSSNRLNAGMVARWSDGNNNWSVVLHTQSDEVQIVEGNTGVFTVRAQTSVTINGATTYDLVIIADGQTISAFVDGTNKASYGSASHNQAATNHGLWAYETGAIAAAATFDNFHIHARTSASQYDAVFNTI